MSAPAPSTPSSTSPSTPSAPPAPPASSSSAGGRTDRTGRPEGGRQTSRAGTGHWWALSFGIVAVLALAGTLERGLAAWRATQANNLIERGETVDRAPAEVLFAHALALERAGRADDALGVYAEAEVVGNEALRQAVHVNVANLYLRRGLVAARDENQAQRAMVLIQLAKAGYRRALREDPDDWNTRYNFELALRILPDLEVRNRRRSGDERDTEEEQKKDKSAWSEMVGQPRGMH